MAIFNIKSTKKSGDKIIVGKTFAESHVSHKKPWQRGQQIRILGGREEHPCNIDKPLNGQHKNARNFEKKVNFWTFELLQLPLVFLLKIFDCSHRLREKIMKASRDNHKENPAKDRKLKLYFCLNCLYCDQIGWKYGFWGIN